MTVSIDDDFAPSARRYDDPRRVDSRPSVSASSRSTPVRTRTPQIPDGAFIEAKSSQVEVDQVLQTLDAKTRQRLTVAVRRAQRHRGRPRGGPAGHHSVAPSGTVGALGEVLRAVGEDGPAIRSLVSQLSEMTDLAASRRDQIASTVANLDALSGSVAQQQAALLEHARAAARRAAHRARHPRTRCPAPPTRPSACSQDLRPATSTAAQRQRQPGADAGGPAADRGRAATPARCRRPAAPAARPVCSTPATRCCRRSTASCPGHGPGARRSCGPTPLRRSVACTTGARPSRRTTVPATPGRACSPQAPTTSTRASSRCPPPARTRQPLPGQPAGPALDRRHRK